MTLPTPARAQFKMLGRALILNDVVCVAMALVGGWFLRFGIVRMPPEYLGLMAVAVPLWPLVFQSFGLYRPQHLTPEMEFRRVITACGAGILVLVLVSFWSKASFSRGWIALALASSIFLELSSRRVWRAYIAEQRAQGALAWRTVVVGANPEGLAAASILSRENGFDVLGLVSKGEDVSGSIGSLKDLPNLIEREEVDCILVVPTALDRREIAEVLGYGRRYGVEVRIISEIPELLTSRLSIHLLGNTMTLVVAPPHLSRFQISVKRMFDVVGSLLLLAALAPVLVLFTLLTLATSGKPVFFRQSRMTKGERTFNILKFRTMQEGSGHPIVDASCGEAEPFFKLGEDDPRITRVGRILRRWSIDELPQLFNVLKGEMSLVGPRPLPAEQVAANRELLAARHEVPAGMTGWWQIRGRSDVSAEEAARLDIFYIENWSLLLDFYILLKTLGAVISRRGAH